MTLEGGENPAEDEEPASELPPSEEELDPLPELEELDPLPGYAPEETSSRQPAYQDRQEYQTVYRVESQREPAAKSAAKLAEAPKGWAEQALLTDPPSSNSEYEARRLPPLMGFEVVR